jgi:hypothetical protein
MIFKINQQSTMYTSYNEKKKKVVKRKNQTILKSQSLLIAQTRSGGILPDERRQNA